MNKMYAGLSAGMMALGVSVATAHPPQAQVFDGDNDGRITRAQIERQAAMSAQELDMNADGQISIEEMQAAHARKRQERMQRRLHRADTNGDGFVGLDEFSAQMVEHVMRRDHDGDGVINLDARPLRDGRRHGAGHH